MRKDVVVVVDAFKGLVEHLKRNFVLCVASGKSKHKLYIFWKAKDPLAEG